MTRIDFYQVSGDEHEFTCRLIDKVYRLGHRIYVHACDASEADKLDEHLWAFQPDSFVPHALQASGGEAPVKIGFDHEPVEHQEVLINLSGEVPDFFSRFERVAEVVPVDENSREAARRNYGFYKDRGYQLNYHKM